MMHHEQRGATALKAWDKIAARVSPLGLAVVVSLLVALVMVLRWRAGAGPYYWLAHAEGVSLTTIGKWQYGLAFYDGMSGEFPVLYQVISDWLMSRLAGLFDVPGFVFQFYYGVALASGIVVVSFFSFRMLFRSPEVALVGALLVALSSDPILVDWLYTLTGSSDALWADKVLHVPATSIGLGTSQGLAYFLFVPAMISAYLALAGGRLATAVLAGVFLGLMFQTSFLTFIGLASMIGGGIFARALALHSARGEKRAVRGKAVAGFLVFAVLSLAAAGEFTFLHFLPLWAFLFAASVTNMRELRSVVVMALAALAAAAPLLLHMWSFIDATEQLSKPVDSPVPLAVMLIFFSPALLSLGLLLPRLRANPFREEIIYLLGGAAALFVIGKGEVWGFTNHQYRFVILLIFPLSALFALAVIRNGKVASGLAASVLLIWMGLSTVRNVAVMAGLDAANVLGSFYYYVQVDYAGEKRTAFFDRLHVLTSGPKRVPGSRILLPPENNYPEGLMYDAMMLGLSDIPGFIPDYRYIIHQRDYRDRLRVFCFLFPAFPHMDHHTALEGCKGVDGDRILDRGVPVFEIRDPSLKTNILGLYGINLIAALQGPLPALVRAKAADYRLTELYGDEDNVIFSASPSGDGLIVRSVDVPGEFWNLDVSVATAGRYTIMLAGEDIGNRFASAAIDASDDAAWTFRQDVIVGEATLPAGKSRWALKACPGARDAHAPAAAPAHFVAVVAADEMPRRLPRSAAAPEAGAGGFAPCGTPLLSQRP